MRRLLQITAIGAITFATCSSVAQAEQPPAQNCYDDSDCFGDAAPYCDVESGICFPCLVDDHCEADFVCHQHDCIPQCFSDADCDAPESYCSGEGVCFECLEDLHCSEDAPLCLVEPGAGECVECIVDEDCSGDTPWCKWSNSCVECLEHADCPEEAHCSQDVCTPDICEPGARSCTENQLWVVECDEFGAREQGVEQCPNMDCEDGVCGGPGNAEGGESGSESGGAESSGGADSSGGSESSGSSGGAEDSGGTTLTDRGCACGAEPDSPRGGLSLLLLMLFGVRARRPRRRASP